MNATRTHLLLELQEVNAKLEAANAAIKRANESKAYYLARKTAIARDLREYHED